MMLTQESPTHSRTLSILRVAAGSVVQVQLLSSDFVRLSTHFHGATVLCAESVECELCDLLPSRPYWYLPARVVATGRSALLEMSAHTASDLEQVARFATGRLQVGQVFDMRRRSKRAPVRCEYCRDDELRFEPSLSDWVSPLMKIFRLPELRADETLDQYGERTRNAVLQRSGILAKRLKHGTSD